MQGKKADSRTIAENRKAFHDYIILECLEAGISLTGTEIKSMRAHNVNLRDSYARIDKGELWLLEMHVSPYKEASYFNHEPRRPRKLLVNKREIRKWLGKTKEKGLTIVPLKLYFKGNWVKVELAIVKGKKLYDKREAIIKKEQLRMIERIQKRF